MEAISTFIIKKAPAWFISWSFRKIFGKRNLAVFERLLEIPKWKKVSFGPNEKWIFNEDNSFTIEKSDESDSFKEPWTDHFPDPNASKSEVYLKIGGELVHKSILFISVDGCRYFVPCPKRDTAYDKTYYYWDKSSLEYKVFNVIGDIKYGNFYKSLEEFGNRCNVLVK